MYLIAYDIFIIGFFDSYHSSELEKERFNLENKSKNLFTTQKLSRLALLAALGSIAVIIEFPILPMVPFLKYDPGDIPILIGALAYGPVPGMLLTIVVAYIQSFVIHGSGGLPGFIMHVLATGAMVIIPGIFSKYFKNKFSLPLSLLLGCVARVVVMIIFNLFITPLYLGAPMEEIITLMPFIILFNIIISTVNSVITYFVYTKGLKDKFI